MKKSELNTGDILHFEDGSRALVMLNTREGDRYIKLGDDGNSWKHGSLDRIPEKLIEDTGNARSSGRVVKALKPERTYRPLPDNSDYKVIWEREPSIDIDIKINGKEANLSDISEETLLSLRDSN